MRAFQITHQENDLSGCRLTINIYYRTTKFDAYYKFKFENQTKDGFDEYNTIEFKMFFDSLIKFISFIQGKEESLCSGKGIQIDGNTKLGGRNIKDGRIAIGVQSLRVTGDYKSHIILSKEEVNALRLIFEHGMFWFAFVKGAERDVE